MHNDLLFDTNVLTAPLRTSAITQSEILTADVGVNVGVNAGVTGLLDYARANFAHQASEMAVSQALHIYTRKQPLAHTAPAQEAL